MKHNRYDIKLNVVLFNKMNNEEVICDIINEDDIEGKRFYVVRVGTRTIKLSKEAYIVKKANLVR